MKYIKLLLVLAFFSLCHPIIGADYVTKLDFQNLLSERDRDRSLHDSLKVFGLSDLYSVHVDNKDIAVYSYYKNHHIISLDYIWKTTTNNHWIQLALGETESKTIEISCSKNANLSKSNTEIVGLDGMPISFVNNKLVLTIEGGRTRRGMVIIDGNESEPLFIFIDPHIDRSKGDSTIVFEGYHKGTYVVPPSINKIVIPLGAYYRGNIVSDHDIEVSGLGIISQEGIKHTAYESGKDNAIKCNISVGGDNNKMVINGITSIEPAMYHFWVWPGHGTEYRNVKSFSFLYETDAYIGTLMQDCFSKVNDDHVKLYMSDIQVEKLYVYQQGNGHVFQFGWGNYGSRSNIHVEDVTVFRDLNRLEECKYVRSFINWRKPDVPLTIKDVTFNHIRFHGPLRSFLVMDNDGKPWKSKPEIRNFAITNVSFYQMPHCKMKLENPLFHVRLENFYRKNEEIPKEQLKDFISEKSFDSFDIQ